MGMILTQAGQNAVNALLASNGTLTIAEMSFGGADRHPTGGETALTNELIRKPVLNKTVEAEKTRFDARLEHDEGPFVIYEIGLHDENGTLIFIGRVDGLTKLVNAGDAHSIDVSASVFTSNFQNVVVKVDSNFAFVPATRKVDAGTGLTGGGDLSEDRTLAVDFASEAEAAAGVSTTKALSPAIVKTLFDALIGAAPGSLDTLQEIAAALNDDANLAATLSAQIAGKFGGAETEQFRVARHHNDDNIVVPYPGGTGYANATVTHTYNYQSRYPDKATTLYLVWNVLVKTTCPEGDKARSHLCLTRPDNTLLTNVMTLGDEFSTTASSYTWTHAGGSATVAKPVGDAVVPIQQRCWLDWAPGNSAANCEVDNIDILVMEVVDENQP